MDAIYKMRKTKLISIKEKYEQLKKVNEEKLPQGDEEIATVMGFKGNKDLLNLQKAVAISHLEQGSRPDNSNNEFLNVMSERERVIKIPKKALCLNTITEIMKLREGGKRLVGHSAPTGFTSGKKVIQITEPETKDIQPYEDVLISIRFYRPFPYIKREYNYGPKFAEEFYVLGSTTLAALRDKINCITNNRCLFDVSDDPYQEVPKPQDNSGFFFITDTFYNDFRNPNNSDYSELIREWVKTRKALKHTEFKTAKMEDTKFMDLEVRLGFPQVYIHQGNCEHLFTFSSIELISPHHDLQREKYPLLNSLNVENVTLCYICARRTYTFVVRKSKRQLHDPSYLCRVCFESFYYVNGKKVGEFEAYHLNPDEMEELVEVAAIVDDDEDEDEEEDEEEGEGLEEVDSVEYKRSRKILNPEE